MPVVNRILIALLAITLSLVAPRPAVAAPVATDTVTKATAYLTKAIGSADHLTSDFGSEGITADAVLALVAAGDQALDPVVARLVGWLQKRAKAYTAKSPEGAAKLALVAAATQTSPSSFGGVDLVAKVAAGVAKDGAFGAYPGAYAQSLGILALVRSGQSVPEPMVTWLLSQQDDTGGFSYQAGKPADADNTGLAAAALAGLATPTANAALARALAWAATNQQGDGSWKGFNPVNSTAVMALGQLAGGVNPVKGLDYLTAQQRPDGSFPNAGKADLLATVQAVLPLAGKTYLTLGAPPSPTPSSGASTSAATPAPTPAPATPASGGGWAIWAWLALAVVLAGAAAVVMNRRRRS